MIISAAGFWRSAGRSPPALAQDSTENFTVIIGGANVGHLDVVRSGDTVKIDYDYKNNGRGPTMKEELKLDAKGMPVSHSPPDVP